MEPRTGHRAAARLGAGSRPVAAELASAAPEMSAQLAHAIGDRLPDLLPDSESFEANRASNEASILGFAQILEQGADPGRDEPRRGDARLHEGRRAAAASR